MELGNELVPIIFWHAHECPAHDDELDLSIHGIQAKAAVRGNDVPYQRCGLNSSVAPRVLVSARKDHTAREWRAYSSVRTPCSFGCCNQNRSRDHQGNNYDDVSNAGAIALMLLGAHAYVPRHRNVRTPMRLTHHGDYRYLGRLESPTVSIRGKDTPHSPSGQVSP